MHAPHRNMKSGLAKFQLPCEVVLFSNPIAYIDFVMILFLWFNAHTYCIEYATKHDRCTHHATKNALQ